MAVSQVGSTTTSYYVTNGANGASASSKTVTSSSTTVSSTTTRSGSASTTSSATAVSSTTAISRTSKGSGSASTTSSTTAISSTTSYASATAKTTCSTTVTYSGSSSTAKVSSTTVATVEPTVINKVGASASTTASTTASMTNKTAYMNSSGTPVYAYLSHMGAGAVDKAKKILTDLGYEGSIEEGLIRFSDDIGLSENTTHSYEVTTELFELGEKIDNIKMVLEKKGFLEGDATVKDALIEFKNSMEMYECGIYDDKVVAEIEKLVDYYFGSRQFEMQLHELGFLNPESGEIDPLSVQASSAPSSVEKAIDNFCRVYGIDKDTAGVDAIMFEIEQVHSYYKNVLDSPKTARMLEELEKVKDEFNESQKINFCKSLTFLELGMKFKDESGKELNDDKKDALIAGILANWCEEGVFSETNAQDGDEQNGGVYLGIDNSEDYKYMINDEVGFGIIQWTDIKRKSGLFDRAVEMESGVGNINTQFATVRYEIEVDDYESNQWSKAISQVNEDVKGIDLARKFASNYLLCVERGSISSKEKREKYAEIIYKGLVGIYE